MPLPYLLFYLTESLFMLCKFLLCGIEPWCQAGTAVEDTAKPRKLVFDG